MRVAWLTDIHLNFVSQQQMVAFLASVRKSDPEAVLLGGDIAEAPQLRYYLLTLAEALHRPIYFVLGNHDYYRGSIARVRSEVARLVKGSPYLRYLASMDVVPLAPDTALIGHDGWADGRAGDYAGSEVLMNDYFLIEELADLDSATRLKKLNALGDEAAGHFRRTLPAALKAAKKVVLLTHVPPFRDACWHNRGISGDDYLPHFVCKAAGDVLLAIMKAHPDHELTVLCGHTHGGGSCQVLPNLLVLTGAAQYGEPRVQDLPAGLPITAAKSDSGRK
jgi:predicted MPP superfamily phosphohydrolase